MRSIGVCWSRLKTDEKYYEEFGPFLRSQGLRFEGDPNRNFNVWILWVFKAWPRDEDPDEFAQENAWKLELLPMMVGADRWRITIRFALPFSHRAHWMLRQNPFLDPCVSRELLAMEGSAACFVDDLRFGLELLTALVRSDCDDSVVHWNDPGPVQRLRLQRRPSARELESWVGRQGYGAGSFERIWWAYHGYCSVRSVLLLHPDGRLCGYFAVEGGNAVLLGAFTSRPHKLSRLAVLAWAALRERLWVQAPRGFGEQGRFPACDPAGLAYGGVEEEYRAQVRSYRLRFTHCAVYVPESSALEGLQSRWIACSEAGRIWPIEREAKVRRREFSAPKLPQFTGSQFVWQERYYEGHVPQYGN